MPIFEKDNQAIMFVHVPKAAGTSVEEVFCSNGFKMSYRRGGRYGELTEFDIANGCSPQHMHAKLLEKNFDAAKFDYVFGIVRSPLDRLVSEYNFRRSNFKNFNFH